MRFVSTTFRKDWRRRWRNPLEILVWVGIPLVVGLLIALAFGGRRGPNPKAHVLVADRDDSFLSHLLVGALSQEAAGGFIRAESADEAAGRARMENGEATAMLVIPEGFSRAVLLEEPAALTLVTNPSQTILPGMVEESLSILADGTFYLHRLIGEDLRPLANGPPPGADLFDDETIAGLGARMNRLAADLKGFLSPPLLRLDASVDRKEAGEVPLALLFLPSILFMALLFMAQGMSDDLWEERNRRTLRRVVCSPQSLTAFLAGKAATAAALCFVVSSAALGAGYAYLRLDPGTLPAAVLWATLSGTMLAAGMTALQLFAPSQRAGNIVSLALVFPLMMAGGSFFPFEAMPKWMAAIGTRTPNGWALRHLNELLTGRAVAADLLGPAVLVSAAVAILLWISSKRLRGGFAQG
jgi:ABC-type multidrug transport system permease subunit